MDKHSVGIRLKSFIISQALSQKDFAKKLDFSDTYISDVVRGRVGPSVILLERINSVFNVSMEWLLTGKGPQYAEGKEKGYISEIKEGLVPYGMPVHPSTLGLSVQEGQLVVLPILSEKDALEVAAKGHEISRVEAEDSCILYKKWLKNPESTLCIQVLQDDMEPILRAGSIVAINTAQKDPVELLGHLSAIEVASRLYLRWLKAIEPHLVFLPQREGCPIYSFSPHDPNPIIGKVEWAWTRF